MKRLKNSNRVSWPSEVDLCQVRLFLSDDCPSQVGLEAQDHLQEKSSWILHSNSMDSDDLPPGFEVSHHANQLKGMFSFIPQMKWKCPPKFVLSQNWQVAAGEESKEVGDQRLRELTVLEAIYPRLSSIPSSPSVSLDIEECQLDDRYTPVIPITPIEEDDPKHLQPDFAVPVSTSITLPPPILTQSSLASSTPLASQSNIPALNPLANEKPALEKLPHSEADITAAAAAAAFTAIMKSNEQGSLIDTNLLIKILSSPEVIEKLMDSCGTPANPEAVTVPASKPPNPSSCLSRPEPLSRPKPSSTTMVPEEAPAYTGTASMPRSKPDIALPSLKPEKVSSLPPAKMLPRLQVPTSTEASPISRSKQVHLLDPLPSSGPGVAFAPGLANGNVNPIPQGMSSGSYPMLSLQNMGKKISSVATKPSIMKDANYYKNLVKLHGGERQETPDPIPSQYSSLHDHYHDPKPVQDFRQVDLKYQKPCIYFNSSLGCKNGSSCLYQHVTPFKWHADSVWEGHGAKRMRLGNEIAGGR
ncbi:zinc finger CCCH domain-containing protein 6-like isoform X3 [Malania oleifera]|nr:zinc finger CCCH domain-containing protein 6-like isoform X2 [Malania oleifera]XP_057962838.1 zinc finger CCCH domain-containing protein 6-like isoform X3 [Malania oleifera]XP_057963517.1 zinc finger CCCH domain-containing protein 6-like isoform X3 [Malania oleifera]